MTNIEEKKYPREFKCNLENISFQLLIYDSSSIANPKKFFNSSLHNHVSTEIFICVNGEITVRTADDKIILKNGDIAVIPPGIPHKNYLKEEGTENHILSFLCFKRKSDKCTDLHKLLSPYISGKNVFIYRTQQQMAREIEALISQSEHKLPFATATNMVEWLIDLLNKESENDIVNKQAVVYPSKFEDINFMAALDHVIEINYDKKISINELAAQLFISARQLDRIAKKRYGKTLHGVFMEKRVQTAEYYLSATNMTVDKIAITVGFNSSVGLYREFMKIRGVTPAEFRKHFKNSIN